MITPIESPKELEKLLRNMLITQSQLIPNRVLNGNSIRGQDLEKMIDSNIYISYNLSDCVIIFELFTRTSEENISMIKSNNSLLLYSSYNMHLIIYGNKSEQLAQILKARLESEKNRFDMYNLGIQIEEISNITTINDFKNETIWIRSDFDIDFACCYSIKQVSEFENYETLETININKI